MPIVFIHCNLQFFLKFIKLITSPNLSQAEIIGLNLIQIHKLLPVELDPRRSLYFGIEFTGKMTLEIAEIKVLFFYQIKNLSLLVSMDVTELDSFCIVYWLAFLELNDAIAKAGLWCSFDSVSNQASQVC